MLILGHLGLTVALVELVRRRLADFTIDYRFLLVGALLPDLVDKPLSLALGIGGRGVTHTLPFVLGFTVLALLLLRLASTKRRAFGTAALLGLVIGSWTHLLLDRMWTQPEILLWPFLGLTFPLDPFDPFNLLERYRDPYVLLGDLLGAGALGYVAWRHRIYRRANLLRFLRKGRLERAKPPHSRRTRMRARRRAPTATPVP